MNLKTAPATMALGGAGMALVAAASWFTVLSPTLSSISDAGTAHAESVDRADNLNLQLISLRGQVKALEETSVTARRLEKYWPTTADQPGFFAEVDNAATDAGIDLDDVTALSPGIPTIVNRGADAAPATTAEAAAEATSETTPAAAADPTTAVVTSRTVAMQDVAISVEGTEAQIALFLKNIQRLDRALLVDTATITASTSEQGDASRVTLAIVGYTFVAPPIEEPKIDGS